MHITPAFILIPLFVTVSKPPSSADLYCSLLSLFWRFDLPFEDTLPFLSCPLWNNTFCAAQFREYQRTPAWTAPALARSICPFEIAAQIDEVVLCSRYAYILPISNWLLEIAMAQWVWFIPARRPRRCRPVSSVPKRQQRRSGRCSY